MNEKQLKFWEGQRRRGYFDFFLGRGLILGMVIGCIIACLDDVFGKGQGVTDWLFSAFWGIMSSVPMTWFEWYSRQRRYRNTIAKAANGPSTYQGTASAVPEEAKERIGL